MVTTVVTDIRKHVDTFIYFLESSLCPQTSIPIYVGHSRPSNGYILYNTEQLSRPSMLSQVVNNIRNANPHEVWDYSKENVRILKDHGILAKYIPLESPDWYIEELRDYRAKNPIEYDVGFAGCLTDRRVYILNKLKSMGLLVNSIEVYGKQRDKELAKCKVLVNIHALPDFKIFESARCEPWLKLGVTVISENSLDNDERCINVEYENMVDIVLKRLKSI